MRKNASTVPSVKEILDGVATEAGLLGAFDETFTSDEVDAARDVAKAMSVVRPLLEHYQLRYEELIGLLSKAQAGASDATVEARKTSQGHLRTFGRLEEGCTSLARELEVAEAAAAAAADTRTLKQQNDCAGGACGEEAATQHRVAAAAEADALAARHRSLVQRRRRMRSALRVLEVSERGRAALETTESEPTETRGARTDQAMKAIESLRGLLDECEGGGDGLKTAIDTRSSPPPTARQRRAGVTAAAARAGREGTGADGDNDDDDADTSRQPSEAVAVDGQLARVARGRLEWLIWRLRGHLSSELASALRQADPLAAGGGSETQGRRGQGSGDGARLSNVDEERRRKGFAGVKEAMTRLIALQFSGWPRQCDPSPADNASAEKQAVSGGSGAPTATVAAAAGAGAGATCGSIWALDGLLEPVALRFRFHFEEERPTNRVDRPEWFLSFLLRALDAYRPLLLLVGDVRTPASATAFGEGRTGAGVVGDWGVGGVDPLAYFARGLTLLARRRLRAQLGAAAADGSLLSHTVEEALAFDRQLDREAGYAECPARFPRQAWPRCVEVFAQDGERFERWMESDANAAKTKLAEAAAAPGAWRAVDWKNGPRSPTPVTPSAVALCRIFSDITERYRPLRDPMKQLRFAEHVQEPVLRSYRDMLYWKGNDCRLSSVFRDGGGDEEAAGAAGGNITSAADGLTATWAAALDAAVLGSGQGEHGDKSPIGRWRCYCLAVASCAYVCAVLRESEDEMLFAEMGEAAAAAAASAALGAELSGGRAGMPSSLGTVGNVVGAAVGGVSQAVTSVATTAETATAGVVRAVGAQGSIIGPTHAISAALTSLQGAARRVRKASSGHHSGSTLDGGGRAAAATGTGTASGTAMREDGIEEGEEGEEGEEEEEGTVAATGEQSDAAIREQVRGLGVGGSGVGGQEGGGILPAVAAAGGVGEWTGSVFGKEAGRYGAMLEAMMRGAVESCRDGFLWRTRSYLRAWDRGIAVVVPLASAAAWSSPGPSAVTEASGRLGEGAELLETAVGVAERCLPPAQFHEFWTALASELDSTLFQQIVARRSELSQDEGLQLAADLKVLMGPFDTLARRRPERHFPALAEAAVLLSLEKSQLRSLSSGLDAHGGGIKEAVRGCGWDGWREEGGALSPEGMQMRDMLENVGVRRLGPAEASLLLDKRLKGDRLAVLGYLSAAAGDVAGGSRLKPILTSGGSGGGEGGGLVPPGPATSGAFGAGVIGGDRGGEFVGGTQGGAAAVPSFG